MDAWMLTIITAVINLLISSIVGGLIKHTISKKIDEQKELFALRTEKEQAVRLEETTKIVRDELQPIIKKLDEVSACVDGERQGTVLLLRDTMRHTRDLLVEQKYTTSADIANWHELYNIYKELGGNHFNEYVNGWKKDVDSLPQGIDI